MTETVRLSTVRDGSQPQRAGCQDNWGGLDGTAKPPIVQHQIDNAVEAAAIPGRLENAAVSPLDLATAAVCLERLPQPPKRVIVIGAGMAGLVAAFALARQGHEPIVLEAQNRVGGRVYTLRDFAPGLHA